jgi:uncharacterized membrane protein YkvA (DUF1232 family)
VRVKVERCTRFGAVRGRARTRRCARRDGTLRFGNVIRRRRGALEGRRRRTVIARVLEAALVGFGACVILLAIGLARLRPAGMTAREAARLVPDTLRLVRSLARDPTTPRSVRRRLLIAVAYNAQPINLIPDFVPVIGLVDNIAVMAWALRSAVRASGPATVARHWQGTDEALVLLHRVLRTTQP